MAIMRTIITGKGAVVDISDAAYAGIPAEEIERRRKNFYKIAEEIFIKAELKRLSEENAENHEIAEHSQEQP